MILVSVYPTAHPPSAVKHDRGKENSNPSVPAAAAWGSAMDTAAARSHDQRIFQLAVPIIQILLVAWAGLATVSRPHSQQSLSRQEAGDNVATL